MTTDEKGEKTMEFLARNWWALLIRGIAAVLFGILALVLPGLTLQVLVLLFGAYALVDGIFALVAAAQALNRRRSFEWRGVGWPIVEGIAGIIAGLLTFFWPRVTAFVLLYFIGAWAIVTGITEIIQAVALRRIIRNEWLLILSGAASVVFGILVYLFPGAGALTIVWLIGAYAIVFGILLIGLSLRLRGMREQGQRMTAAY